MDLRRANCLLKDYLAAQARREKGVNVTSEAPEVWFVMLQDDAAAGRVAVPLKPFLRYNRRMDKQLTRLERKTFQAIPQLALRGQNSGRARGAAE